MRFVVDINGLMAQCRELLIVKFAWSIAFKEGESGLRQDRENRGLFSKFKCLLGSFSLILTLHILMHLL